MECGFEIYTRKVVSFESNCADLDSEWWPKNSVSESHESLWFNVGILFRHDTEANEASQLLYTQATSQCKALKEKL